MSVKYGDICDKCAHCEYCDMATFGGHNPQITACCKFAKRHQTNADRIRSMSDEELADFIGGIFTIETDLWGDYDPRLVVTQEPRVEIRDKEGMMDWLKAPAEEGEG